MDAAAALFMAGDYDAVNLNAVAQEVGITKPALYRYFRSKEVLFLALFDRELAGLQQDFAKVRETRDVAATISHIFVSRPLYCRLSAILHTVLERDLHIDEARTFKQSMKATLESLVGILCGWLPALAADEATSLLLQMQQALIGVWHMTHPVGAVAAVISEPELALFKLEFRPSLEAHLRRLLEA